MSAKPIVQAGPDHPITIEPAGHRVTVTSAGQTIADSERAVTIREANYPPVQYIPLEDVDASQLKAAAHAAFYADRVAISER